MQMNTNSSYWLQVSLSGSQASLKHGVCASWGQSTQDEGPRQAHRRKNAMEIGVEIIQNTMNF